MVPLGFLETVDTYILLISHLDLDFLDLLNQGPSYSGLFDPMDVLHLLELICGINQNCCSPALSEEERSKRRRNKKERGGSLFSLRSL